MTCCTTQLALVFLFFFIDGFTKKIGFTFFSITMALHLLQKLLALTSLVQMGQFFN
jgi:hypothetical protein